MQCCAQSDMLVHSLFILTPNLHPLHLSESFFVITVAPFHAGFHMALNKSFAQVLSTSGIDAPPQLHQIICGLLSFTSRGWLQRYYAGILLNFCQDKVRRLYSFASCSITLYSQESTLKNAINSACLIILLFPFPMCRF